MAARDGLMSADHAVRQLQDALWTNVDQRQGRLGLGISAFPSVHVGIAALVMVYFVSLSRVTAVFGIAYCALTQWSSVIYGWHYAIDGYASILMVIAVWIGTGWLAKRSVNHAIATQDCANGTPRHD